MMKNKKLLNQLLKKTSWRRIYCDTFYCYWDVNAYIDKLIEKKNNNKTMSNPILENLNLSFT